MIIGVVARVIDVQGGISKPADSIEGAGTLFRYFAEAHIDNAFERFSDILRNAVGDDIDYAADAVD